MNVDPRLADLRAILVRGPRILHLRAVIERTGLSRTTIWRLERAGQFPSRRRLTPGRVGWLESEIDDFIASAPLGGPLGSG